MTEMQYGFFKFIFFKHVCCEHHQLIERILEELQTLMQWKGQNEPEPFISFLQQLSKSSIEYKSASFTELPEVELFHT